ncbi:armadillo-type protein [Suillus clintonianus]|uniref:armadillo-type protein n=1 Tax=Suillus clintonianus TaxID=1904413 RepID=UPI001B881BE6|nr:armadillo-type protein [Suillus clintonianus]KAG2121247.1 armadillo-type protein [Suillus clintonianus]
MDDEDTSGRLWSRDLIQEDWQKVMQIAQGNLLTSSTRIRLQFLQEELLWLATNGGLSLRQTMDVFKLLTQTYPRYVDSLSRDAVEEVGMTLIEKDETADADQKMGVTEQVLGWLANEVSLIAKRGSSSTYAPADIFVLLSWACGLYTTCLRSSPGFTSSPLWKMLVDIFATLLDMQLNRFTRTKPTMQKSALVRTRRALRSAPEQIPALMTTLIAQAKSSQTPLIQLSLLSTAVDVTLRLKYVKDESLTQISPAIKDDILDLYTTCVVMSKNPVPSHSSSALHDFIGTCVTSSDLTAAVLPTMEKALLRSPEYSLSVIADFLLAYSHTLDSATFKKLLTASLNSAKSNNPVVRTNATGLFKVLISKDIGSTSVNAALTDVLALPKTGKTTGPEHRLTLYAMLAAMPPSAEVSVVVVQNVPQLLVKETTDAAVGVLASIMAVHLTFILKTNTKVPADATTVIAKEMTNPKHVIRRAFVSITGSALWSVDTVDTDAVLAFSMGVTSALETNLKVVTTNPLTAAVGPFEGYVALALLMGPLANTGKFGDIITRNASIEVLTGTQAKPSFLISDKIYQKLTDTEDEIWLLRAVNLSLFRLKNELAKSEQLRLQIGSVFVHLSIHSQSSEVRRLAIQTIEAAVALLPQLVILILREAMTASLIKEKSAAVKSAPVREETEKPVDKQRRYAALLLCCGHKEEAGAGEKDNQLVDLIVLAHHSAVCPPSRLLWIELCQKAGVDPHHLISRRVDQAMTSILTASAIDSKFGFADASYQAISTLAFVCPENALPKIMEQLRADIDSSKINALSEAEFGIWKTPEGTTYVDVLSSQKVEEGPKKGKDADIARWEAELRKSLANKKGAATATLSKQAQALVQAQLDKEAIVRQRVTTTKLDLQRGLSYAQSLASINVPELRMYVSFILSLLLEGAMGQGSRLVGSQAFEAYLDLAKCCSVRLDTFHKWVGVATLRSLEIASVPEELRAEQLSSLVLRVLYRLRSLSEQAPFDAATFSYAFPLLAHVLLKGGVDAGEDDGDEALEQVTLVLDIIRFHCSEFSDAAFPRKATMEHVLHVVRHQPRLSKEASSVLIDLGEAVQSNATRDEVGVLIDGTLLQEVYVRNACLQAIQPFDLTDLDWSPQLWIACHDDDEQNARLANHVWEDNGLDVPEDFLDKLLNYLDHNNAYVRTSTASAIAEAVIYWPRKSALTVAALQDFYREKAKILAPEFDEYGMVIASSLDRSDPWAARVAVALAFEHLAESFTEDQIEPFFVFLIEDEALGDRSPDVRRSMLRAGTAVIDLHGSKRLAGLLSTFEEHLGGPSPANETGDQIKEAVVILFGRVARHLDASDTRIPSIVNRLVEALKTPAEQVQIAVSDCLVPLVKLMGPGVRELVDHLFEELFNGTKYASRRGAAYGLAGTIKGLGVGAMKEYDVINRLRTAAEDKKRFETRQGALFAFETLSNTLGRLFEPYITFILPILLTAFGDATADVREAAQDAARVIMGNMSGYGVKLILPSLLSGLDEKQWRSKKGSIELMGMMAYCSPRQLSLSLPIVIPRLTGVLTDTHAQVKTAANKSLKQFGEVINNPEIQALVPTLLKALVDPAKTTNALSALLKTSFMHYIDHSSLALVIPIIERGLRERGTEGKKRAAQIVGNLASLTDSKDFVPYLSSLLPLVHVVLVDPVPEARATAAKALGTLVERLGEVHFPDVVPGLLRTLKTDTSGVDRQGAAQGLSEVLSGLGMERLEGLLPDIIANAQSPRSTVREGFMSLLVYLPATFGARFQPHLPKIISPILSGLSDTEEYVRDAAMRAGRMIVTNYSTKAIDLLLPELEQGMFDAGWRIRQSSITLVGELLFKVSGISGKAEVADEEEVAEVAVVESSRRALTEVLGEERRNRILSALYLARQDAVNVVRQSSIHIWKALVHNTPRTVREILPELVGQLVKLYSSQEFEQQETASRTTAELSRKSGEKVLGEIFSILHAKSHSPDISTREGVCLMLCDVMESTSGAQRDGHENEIINMVRASLVDDDATVRSAAAKAFDVLQEHLGAKAIDQTIPTLLEALRQPGASSDTALQALREVMSVRASTVFPVLIPTLIATPMTVFNARALASLVTVAGHALSKRLIVILGALVKVLEEEKDDELQSAIDEAVRALLASIEDPEGLNTLMLLLLGWAKNDAPKRRISSCDLFAVFCEESDLDSSLYRVDWVRQLVSLFDDQEVPVHTAAWRAFDVFVKSMPKDELESLVVPLRRTIESTGAPGRYVPGFSLPKGVAPTVPIIIAGLTAGSNEQRENAAYAIGDLVERTEEAAIKPFVVPFTGPLIRVATQATTYPPGVKTAILSALASMLERIPGHVKPFFPQLQRTFVKAVSDASSVVVRTRAADALGILMHSQPRVDPVITELIAGARSSEEEIAASFVLALSNVVKSSSAHGGIGEKARESCIELVNDAFRETHEDHYVQATASLIASLSANPQSLKPIVNAHLISGTPPSTLASHAILAVLSPDSDNYLEPTATLFAQLGLLRSVAMKVKESVANERSTISRPAREARDILKNMVADEESLAGIF